MRFQDVIATGLFIISAMIFGREIKLWSKAKISGTHLEGIVPGMALMGIVFHVFGAIGVLHRGTLFFLPSALLLRQVVSAYMEGNCSNRLRTTKLNLHKPLSNWPVYAFGVIILKPIFTLSIRKQDAYDALAYQMYAPLRALFQTHSFNANELVANAGLPVGAGSLHGWLVAFGLNPLTGVATSVFALLLIFLIVNSEDRPLINLMKISAVFGIIFALGGSVFGSVNSDLAMVPFVVYVIRQIATESSQKINLQSVVVLGFIPLIKPFAIIFCLALMVSIGWNKGKGKYQILKLCSVVSIPYMIWCLKNFYQVQNPFYPMFQKYFGGPGYGAEIMTLESDVRRSFTQFADVMHHMIINPIDTLNKFGNWLILPLLVTALLINFVANRKGHENFEGKFAIWFSIITGVIIAGPVGRYALYGLVVLTLYGVLAYEITTKDRFLSRNRRVIVTVSTMVLVTVPMIIGLPNFVKALMISKNDLQTDVDVENVQIAASEVIPKESSICVIGDNRALLFYPNLVFAFESNRKNPFSKVYSKSVIEITSELKLFGCDFAIVHWGWGFPQNINVDDLKAWSINQKSDGNQIYNTQNWQIFRLDG